MCLTWAQHFDDKVFLAVVMDVHFDYEECNGLTFGILKINS